MCDEPLLSQKNLIPEREKESRHAHLTPAHTHTHTHMSSSVSGQRHTLTALLTFWHTHTHTLMPRNQLTAPIMCWNIQGVCGHTICGSSSPSFVYLFIHSSFHPDLPPLLEDNSARIRSQRSQVCVWRISGVCGENVRWNRSHTHTHISVVFVCPSGFNASELLMRARE